MALFLFLHSSGWIISWPNSKFSDPFPTSGHLLSPSCEFFISIIVLFNAKLSIWLYLYNFYLPENSLFGETSFLLSFTSFHMVSFGSSNGFKIEYSKSLSGLQGWCLGFVGESFHWLFSFWVGVMASYLFSGLIFFFWWKVGHFMYYNMVTLEARFSPSPQVFVAAVCSSDLWMNSLKSVFFLMRDWNLSVQLPGGQPMVEQRCS